MCPSAEEVEVRIQKLFGLFLATEMISEVYNSIHPVNNVGILEILSSCLYNHKNILEKTRVKSNKRLLK